MAKMKFKFDAKQLKQLLRERVELVALGVCGLLMVVFILIGLGQAFSASSPAPKIAEKAKALSQAVAMAGPAPESKEEPKQGEEPKVGEEPKKGEEPKDPPKAEPEKKPLPTGDWVAVRNPERFVGGNWFDALGAADTKKRNPFVLPIDGAGDDRDKYIQIHAVHAAVQHYTVDQRGRKIWTAQSDAQKGVAQFPPLAVYVRGEKLVIVHATFPYKEQIDLFLKALRIDKDVTLYQRGLMPTFAGLNVYRGEKAPGAKDYQWAPVYMADKKGVVTASAANKRLLTDAIYDEEMVGRYYHVMPVNAATPLPRPAYGRYPKLDLEGIIARGMESDLDPKETEPKPKAPPKNPKDPKGGRPAPSIVLPGAKQKDGEVPKDVPQLTIKPESFVPLPKAFKDRLQGDVNYFHPYGAHQDPKDDKSKLSGGEKGMPGMPSTYYPGGSGRPPGTPPRGSDGKDLEDPTKIGEETPFGMSANGKVLVRFVDADVKPGYTYQYAIQVRLVNPNFGKKSDVAFDALAEQKELVSATWTLTPEVTVAKDFHFYAVDQQPLFTKSGGSERGIDRGAVGPYFPHEKVPVQIHKWVDEVTGKGIHLTVADWVIGERFLMARGEPIGRSVAEVELPRWITEMQSFVLGDVRPATAKSGAKVVKTTIPVDFTTASPPVLVDFSGGKGHYNVDTFDHAKGTAKRETIDNEESATELLVMTPEGKLLLRNSREDSDAEAPTGHDRLTRYDHWKARLTQMRERPTGIPPTDGMPPMGGTTPPPGGRN